MLLFEKQSSDLGHLPQQHSDVVKQTSKAFLYAGSHGTWHLSECCQYNQQDREFNGAQTNHEYQMVLNVGNLYTSLNLKNLIN